MDALDSLNTPITAEEAEEVLKLLHSGKSPGPMGLPTCITQFLGTSLFLSTILLLGDGLSQSNMLHSYITMIPKPNKDPLDFSNYRPIGLLNSDHKIFTKMLANRLSIWLPICSIMIRWGLYHADKVGTIPGGL